MNDLDTLKAQLAKLPTISDITELQAELNELPGLILRKLATDGDYVTKHNILEQLKLKFHERAPLEQRIRELTFAQQEQRYQQEQAMKAKIKSDFADKYKLYQQNCQRLLSYYIELRDIARTNPQLGFNELRESTLHLPAIHSHYDIGCSGGSLVR